MGMQSQNYPHYIKKDIEIVDLLRKIRQGQQASSSNLEKMAVLRENA